MVPTKYFRRLFRLHVRERRHVVRTIYHHRRRIAPRLPSLLLGPVYPDLGGHLDIHRHARDFHFALSAVHPFSADDRDVGSEDRRARGGRALRLAQWAALGGRWREGAHMRTPSGHKVYAMAAEYPTAAALYEAAKRVRDAGYRRWDVYSPFPIHGMDDAMGLGKSWLSGWVLFGGISGLLTVPAFFPIMFELTVLFAAFAAFFAWLGMNRLPRWYHPMFNWERFSRVTNDGFFLAIEARDPRFTESGVRELLEKSGGQHITIVHED